MHINLDLTFNDIKNPAVRESWKASGLKNPRDNIYEVENDIADKEKP